MNYYFNEACNLLDFLEESKLTAEEITDKCIDVAVDHHWDREYLSALNDALWNHGYITQFEIDSEPAHEYDKDEYQGLMKNAGMSAEKTKALVDYLAKVKNWRMIFSSLHKLRVRHLMTLGILPDNNRHILKREEKTFRDLYFWARRNNNNMYYTLTEVLEHYLGLEDAGSQYMQFRLDVEMLLWTLERDDKDGYLKVNTIKVANALAPKDLFEGDKIYYKTNLSKYASMYLNQIDKEYIAYVKEEWGDYHYDNTGYAVLYRRF